MTNPVRKPASNTSLSLGLERIGLLPVLFPWLSALVVIAVTGLAIFGFTRLSVDDSLSELFKTNTPAFQAYERMAERFPTSEFDVLIVAEGDNLMTRDTLQKLRNVILDLQLVSSVRNLVSLFSAREPPDAAGDFPPALFPAVLPEGADFERLVERVKSNKIIQGKLLSDDGKLTLVVIALDPKTVAGTGLAPAVNEIRSIALNELKGTGLNVQLSGAPVMQHEIRNAVERDRFVYNGAGLILGSLIAIAFFRRVSLMLAASVPPILAVVWSLGVFGLIGFKLNLFLNVMTPLVMVLGFSDSMQLTFAIRDRLHNGMEPKAAIREALAVVGPACVLASVTASASFLTLLFVSNSALITTFGAAGAISTLVAYLASIIVVPLIAVFLFKAEDKKEMQSGQARDAGIDWLKRLCSRLADFVVANAGKVVACAIALVVLFGSVYLNLNPRYRLADQVPDREEAVAASKRLDAKLTGANPLEVMIEWPKDRTLYEAETVAVIGEVHSALERQKGVGNVWSVETLVRWMKDSRDYSLPRLEDYIKVLPPHLVRRFLDLEADSALANGRIPDLDASQILPVVGQLEKELDAVRKKHPEYTITVTGLAVVAARNSADMISGLNFGLIGEMLFISAFLGLVFRSLLVGGASLLPNLFPIFAAGGILAASSAGLQFASIIALTIAFGLALNAAVHYFNRFRLEDKPGQDPKIGVANATRLVGPAVILTTMVLAVGLGVTTFSDLPSLRLFGWLTAFTLIAGLIGDLVILPAVLLLLRRAGQRLRA